MLTLKFIAQLIIDEDCNECNGTGEVYDEDGSIDGEENEMVTCPECDGDGIVGDYEMEQFGTDFEIADYVSDLDSLSPMSDMVWEDGDDQYVICDTPFPELVDENDNIVAVFNTESMLWEIK